LDSRRSEQSGSFCVFTKIFIKDKSYYNLEDLPIFQPGSVPVFEIDDNLAEEIEMLFNKIKKD
jgi:hypothetical protein